MPDHTPLSEAELSAVEADMRNAAHIILRGFARERTPVNVALGIIGMVATRLLEHAPHHRAEFIACLQDHDPDA